MARKIVRTRISKLLVSTLSLRKRSGRTNPSRNSRVALSPASAKGFPSRNVQQSIGEGRAKLADVAEHPAEQDDARLISAVAHRDAIAFRALAERHAPALHRLAYRMLGDGSEAEDVVQESLLRLWDHAARWRPVGGGVPGWLRRIATNLCLDRLRRTARLSDAPVPERADPAPAADARIDGRRLGDVAQTALRALPDRQRAAIVLTYYEQLGNAAAADAMDLKLKAFESLLVRARSALRDHVRNAGISAADLEAQA